MQKDLKDSIKARLYDFKYTPFLSAYIFSWIYFNSKLILIFAAPKLSVEKKIEMLSWGQINYETPLYFALAYVFIFPLATALFYAVTLGYKALMNWIQQKIQDKTPLPQEQANTIREENIKLTLEHREVMEKIEKVQLEYSSKEKILISQFSEKEKTLEENFSKKESQLEEKINSEVESKVKDLSDKLEKTYKVIEDRNNEINDKQKTINTLETKISELEAEVTKLKPVTKELPIIDNAFKKANESNDSIINGLTIEQIKVLATFFTNDSLLSSVKLKNYINSNFKLSKTLVEVRINELSALGLVRVDGGYYRITNSGKEVIEKIFT
ncbi:hypothetical protein [Arcobacter roscoffensis]|uniref:Uncharacterized protein n=1 Tax=Arcobacter roscoffensis TaxID=2961520 RepID=A0ABY5E0W5_9BACT|nr:hypothetical protein [Arcobacter roscoffensis]UTJ05849.1 hypothetical protein NJU99_11400 [Arcobacter roscoffensis]